mmetsp:Transcript_52438/g.170256  ORF Transcript_52438/g.170256 Transcript_52438/m.170256 type:complete len:239 (+) Transcript_52438:379-1095(+)
MMAWPGRNVNGSDRTPLQDLPHPQGSDPLGQLLDHAHPISQSDLGPILLHGNIQRLLDGIALHLLRAQAIPGEGRQCLAAGLSAELRAACCGARPAGDTGVEGRTAVLAHHRGELVEVHLLPLSSKLLDLCIHAVLTQRGALQQKAAKREVDPRRPLRQSTALPPRAAKDEAECMAQCQLLVKIWLVEDLLAGRLVHNEFGREVLCDRTSVRATAALASTLAQRAADTHAQVLVRRAG